MAQNIKTIVKIFLLFFVFQICINIFGVIMPSLDKTFDDDKQDYLDFLLAQVNGQIDSSSESNTLIENMEAFIKRDNLFTGGIINAFLGVLQVIGDAIVFITQLVITILITPGIMMNILLYNLIVSTGYLIASKVIVTVFFYMTMYYIILKRRVSQ